MVPGDDLLSFGDLLITSMKVIGLDPCGIFKKNSTLYL
jgi:hypothetical protein